MYKKKILYVVRTLRRGGPVNVVFSIIKKLDKTKFTPIILTLKQESEESRINDFTDLGIEVMTSRNILTGAINFFKIIHKNKFTVIHSHGLFPDLINSMLGCGIFSMTTIHNYPYDDYPLLYGKFMGRMMAIVHVFIQRRLFCVACSNSIKNAYKKNLNIDSIVIVNGVDYEHNLVLSSQNDVQKRLIYLGKLENRKNLDFLISSFIAARLNNCVLDIVGDGILEDSLRKKYGKYPEINFHGYTDNPQQFVKNSFLMISASTSEGLPMSLLESLSFGVPLFVSNIPSHLEIINSGKFGTAFENNNEINFTENLRNIIKTDFNRSSVYNDSKVIFSNELMASKYETIYSKN